MLVTLGTQRAKMHGFLSLEHKHRVRTDFLSKIQDFLLTFSKTIITFSRLKVLK